MELYPLKFKPIIKEKIWGGKKLESILEKDCNPEANNGESWEISDLDENISVITNGFLAENDLREILELYLCDLVGESVYNKFGLGFPLLIKFIDAAENLSIQVHPNDELAMERYGLNGKNEAWYVVEADENAGLYVGFQNGVTKADYIKAVEKGNLDTLMNFYPVKSGDFFFIPAGTVHAIGKGVLLAEIQQASDITYRIFDWNRLDDEGFPRELHCAEALDAICFDQDDARASVQDDEAESIEDDFAYEGDPYHIIYQEQFNQTAKVFRSEFFKVNMISCEVPIEKNFMHIDSFVIYICTEGRVHLVGEGFHEVVYTGETIMVPAIISEITLIPTEKSKLLEVFL